MGGPALKPEMPIATCEVSVQALPANREAYVAH